MLRNLVYLEIKFCYNFCFSGICRQWQMAPLQLWKPRNFTHLQSHWKKQSIIVLYRMNDIKSVLDNASRSSSRMHNYPILSTSPTLGDEDDLDELMECDRFSQVSSSVVTSLNIDEQHRINHLEQTLADLQKQMALLLQTQQKSVEKVT